MNSEIKINYLDINSNNAVPANKNICTVKQSNLYNNIPIVDLRSEQRDIVQITDQSISRKNVGGKGSALYRMQQAGMLVPEFTTIDVKYIKNLEQHSLDIASLKPFINDITSFNLAEVNIANIKQYIQNRYSNQPEQRNLYLQGLAKFIASNSFYQQISNSQTAESIRENYNQLIASLPEDSAIIVRSSGIKEDNYGDAQAGKFESLVHGKQDIVLTCLQVLASGFQPYVCPFSAPQPMSLIIQRCIDCSFGGVAMSRTSFKDHRGKIEFVPGQPKGGVSGVAGVTPHTYLVTEENDKFTSDFTEGNVTSQFILQQQDNNNFEEKPVALTENSSVNLTEEQLKQIYQYIKQGEDMLLCPVDFEFAIAKDGTVYALQLRPLTVLTGGVNFAIDPPENPITTGTLISEGFCAGELFYVQSEQDADLVPQGAIVVANHGETWMVDNNQFFKKVGGFIFQQGGANDHIAITMRQQEKPYLVTTDNFDELKHSNAIVSLACGNFKENPGAYVTTGSEFADKLATMQSTVKADYQLRSSEAPVRKTPELYFNRPDIAFKNLHDLNYILLDYFGADSWLTRCFTEKGMLLLSMAPHRIEIIKESTEEIGQLFATFDLFLQGYKQYLQLGIKPKKYIDYLKLKLAEAEKLIAKFNNIKTRVNNNLDNILQQFIALSNQAINQGDFNNLLQEATSVFTSIQTLNIPKNINDINSLHDSILWIHREFIEILAPIAINSDLGIITEHKYKIKNKDRKVTSIIFSDTKGNRAIEKICVDALINLKSYNMPKIVIIENSIIATIKLGTHICIIEMIEQAEADKGRTLKLKLSDFIKTDDYHEQGKLKRFWFLAQLLHNIAFVENTSEMKVSIDEATCMLSIEIPHIKTKEIILDQFVKIIPILNSLKDLDLTLNQLIMISDESKWNFAMLKRKIKHLSSSTNQEDFTFLMLLLGYDKSISADLDQICSNTTSSDFFELGKELFESNVENIVNKIPIKDKERLLYNLVINDVHAVIPFAKIQHGDWFTEKKNALKLISYNGLFLRYLPPDLCNDIDVVLAASAQNISSLSYAGIKVINNKEFIIALIEFINNKYLQYELPLEDFPYELKNNKEFILGIMDNFFNLFYSFTDELKKDQDIALIAVKNGNNNLQYVGNELKKNKSLVLTAINHNAKAFFHASDELRNNKQFILKAIKENFRVYYHLNDRFKKDTEILQAYNTAKNKL